MGNSALIPMTEQLTTHGYLPPPSEISKFAIDSKFAASTQVCVRCVVTD